MKIAIVGAGISGGSVLKSIIDHPHFKREDEIHVFEPRDILGVGLPYSPDDKSVMLNVSPDSLGIKKDNPLDFKEWLNENFDEPTNFEDLVSRPRYGEYLAERLDTYFSHKQVRHIKTKIVDIDVLDRKTKEKITESKDGDYTYRLKTEDNWEEDLYDAVFLALGHPEYPDYYNLNGAENYISNPYPMKDKLSGFTGDEKIGIIGSGATGVDLMRFFASNYDLKHPLTFYVRDKAFNFADIPYEKEDFKFTFSMEWIKKEKEKSDGIIDFDLILSTFIEDIKEGGVDVFKIYNQYKKGDLDTIRRAVELKDQELALIHAYNSKLVAYLPHLYNSLSGQDKEFYLENYHNKLLFFKSRVPYNTFIWLFKLMDQGKLKVVYGLTEIKDETNEFFVTADKNENVDILINATGFDSKLSRVGKNSPLIYNLFQKNVILPHFDGRYVLVDWPQAQIINQKFGLMDNLFFFGLLIGGTQHENNDAQLTHKLATRAATWLMDRNKHSK